MSQGRGALLVLEGCDRAGKSTQVRMLVDALNKRGIPSEARSFPDRSTAIGAVINNFLTKKDKLVPEAAHLLFSANRWECSQNILNTLEAGTTLVIDRYAASGAAYTAAWSKRSLSWCKESDRGLPCPDLVTLLDVPMTSLNQRNGWGEEQFETNEVQQKVASNYCNLKDETWIVINADQDVSVIHEYMLAKALKIIEQVKQLPVKRLYEY